jgi:predicted transcriptional regulator
MSDFTFTYRHIHASLHADARMRQRADWMTHMDDLVLEILQSSGLVLSPSIIAFNLDASREAVNRRLKELTEYGLVERIERGKYRITRNGETYLDGNLDASELLKNSGNGCAKR